MDGLRNSVSLRQVRGRGVIVSGTELAVAVAVAGGPGAGTGSFRAPSASRAPLAFKLGTRGWSVGKLRCQCHECLTVLCTSVIDRGTGIDA